MSKIVEPTSLPLGDGRSATVHSELACVARLTGARARRVIVGLHGFGDNARNFSELAEEFALEDTLWVFPFAPDPVPMTFDGGQWYNLYAPARADVERSAAFLARLIEGILAATGLPPSSLCLLGFSQGAYMTLYTTLRSPHRLGGAVALSGYLAQVHRTPLPLPEHVRQTPFFVAHGLHDNVVLPASHFETVDALDTWGCTKVRHKTYPVAHSLHPTELADVRAFLRDTETH